MIMMGGAIESWGYIPTFLDEDDPRPAAEQFNANYIGGWNPFEGFSFDIDDGTLKYPGDPVMRALSAILFRDEWIILFPHEWVMIIQQDKSWQVSRMD